MWIFHRKGFVPGFAAIVLLLGLVFLVVAFVPLETTVQLGADEGFEMAKVELMHHGYELYNQAWNDQPPLHTSFLAGLIDYFDGSIFVARATTVAFALLFLGAAYLIVARSAGAVAGCLCMLLVLASPGFVELSVSCMLEIPALACAVSALACLLLLKQRPLLAILFSAVCFALALSTKLVVLILLPVAALIFFLSKVTDPRTVRRYGQALRISSLQFGILLLGTGLGFLLINWMVDGGAFLRRFHLAQFLPPHSPGMPSFSPALRATSYAGQNPITPRLLRRSCIDGAPSPQTFPPSHFPLFFLESHLSTSYPPRTDPNVLPRTVGCVLVMKNRIWPLLCLGVIGLIVVLWWGRRPDGTPSELSQDTFSNGPPQVPAAARSGEPQPGDPGYRQYRFEQRERDSLWDYKRPIQFYGQVVDELGNPISGLRVDFIWKDLSLEGTSKVQTATDASGQFSLRDVSGKLLTIRLDDTEYNILSKQNQFGFEYANPHVSHFHVPNPKEPVIFRVQRRGEPAPLIKQYVKVRFLKNGEPTTLNLLTGEQSDNGQFQVRVWAQERDPMGRYDWKVSLKMIQGGIMEASEEFPSKAPLSGYKSSVEFSTLASDTKWQAALEKQFYFVIASPPQYGRMRFSAKIYGGGYFVDYFINPTGERNLVYDPLRDLDLP